MNTTGIDGQTVDSPQREVGVCSAGVTLVLLGFLIAVGGVSGVVGADGGQGTVSPVVADATGEQVVVVDVESDWTAESTPTTVEQLEQRATRSQAPLRQYAEQTPGVAVEHSFWLGNLAVVTIDHSRTDVTELAEITNVVHVGPNFEVSVDRAGPDPDTTGPVGSPPGQTPSGPPVTGTDRGLTATDTTYGLDQINATEVWSAYGTRGEGVSVAVLDTGVDDSHPDLDVAAWAEFDSSGDQVNTMPNDGDGHGTHVSGTVTGAENPAGGVSSFGVAPGAELYGVKVLDDSGGGSFAQIIAGMQWAVDNDADIISMSLGATGFFDQMIDPVRNAKTAGTLVVASAGNSGAGSSGSPGNVYDSFGVGASNESRGIATFSSGETVNTSDWSSPPAGWPDQYVVPDIAAPGVAVLSSVPGGGYDDTYSGTSMAAPHVSGAAALLQSATGRSLSVERIETLLVDTARKPDGAPTGPDTRYGNGIIDAKAAVDLATRANFTVSIAGTTTPVEGEPLNVTAEIQNTGAGGATQTITLDVGALGTNSTSVTLGGGASTNVTLSVGTGSGAAGEYTATVSSADDTSSTSVTVNEVVGFDITLTGENISVTLGETATVNVTVTNTETTADSQRLNLTVNGTVVDTTTVSLGDGKSTTVQLAWETGAGDAGNYTAQVSGDDDVDVVGVAVAPLTVIDYANESRIVTTFGLFDAVDDWRTGRIGTPLLFDVVSAWRNDTQV